MLSKQQIDQFHRDGYLVVRGMYTAEEMQEISRWTDEVASSPERPGHYMMYFEASKSDGSRIISRIEDFVSFHEGFAELITRRRMHEAVSELFGEDAVLFKDNLIKKVLGVTFIGDAVNLVLIAMDYKVGGIAPIALPDIHFMEYASKAAYPLTIALVLTNIVIAVATVSLILGLVIRLYGSEGTLSCRRIWKDE